MKLASREWFFLIAAGWLLVADIGAIEGRLAPAAAPAVITRIEQTDLGLLVFGESARPRPECSFEAVVWRLGARSGASVPVAVSFPAPIVRASGRFSFGPWLLADLHGVDLRDGSFADVLHRCRIFYRLSTDSSGRPRAEGGVYLPWLTRSRFWN